MIFRLPFVFLKCERLWFFYYLFWRWCVCGRIFGGCRAGVCWRQVARRRRGRGANPARCGICGWTSFIRRGYYWTMRRTAWQKIKKFRNINQITLFKRNYWQAAWFIVGAVFWNGDVMGACFGRWCCPICWTGTRFGVCVCGRCLGGSNKMGRTYPPHWFNWFIP